MKTSGLNQSMSNKVVQDPTNRIGTKIVAAVAGNLQPVFHKKVTLEIKNLGVAVEGKEILKDFSLTIKAGEMHIMMGPNGSGKSTLCNALMGHPKYKITGGAALLNGVDLAGLTPDKRAQLGLFLAFQYPREIPGITFGNFLRHAVNAVRKAGDSSAKPYSPAQFVPIVQEQFEVVKMNRQFIGRSVNEGFSGGEKKRAEIIQMAALQPKIAMLDEIDSGLDIDALKIVANGIQEVFQRTNMGVLLITHYQRILNYLQPQFVHIMVDGKIVKSGGRELAAELEKNGYEPFVGINNY
jgi:Fe-S cluster assembly ATP-binding protein